MYISCKFLTYCLSWPHFVSDIFHNDILYSDVSFVYFCICTFLQESTKYFLCDHQISKEVSQKMADLFSSFCTIYYGQWLLCKQVIFLFSHFVAHAKLAILFFVDTDQFVYKRITIVLYILHLSWNIDGEPLQFWFLHCQIYSCHISHAIFCPSIWISHVFSLKTRFDQHFHSMYFLTIVYFYIQRRNWYMFLYKQQTF